MTVTNALAYYGINYGRKKFYDEGPWSYRRLLDLRLYVCSDMQLSLSRSFALSRSLSLARSLALSLSRSLSHPHVLSHSHLCVLHHK